MIEVDIHKKLHSSKGPLTLSFSTSFESNGISVITGPSGAGKTTLLKILAGLARADSGRISVQGKEWLNSDKNLLVKPQNRSIGYVFQEYALFPNMSVLKNLQYALPKGENSRIIDELTEIMELRELLNRKPMQLSGGQKQRVALARALVRKPQLLLLDEPLSALDHKMRMRLQDHIIQATRQYGLTTLLVSHDLPEIFKLAQKVIEIDEGKITREGTPAEVYSEKHISSKFKVTGEVLEISKEDVIFIVSVLAGSSIIKVIASSEEIQELSVGDKVMVASKAFNPVITKMKEKNGGK